MSSRVKATFHLELDQAAQINLLTWHQRGLIVGIAVRRFLRTQEGRQMLLGSSDDQEKNEARAVLAKAKAAKTKKRGRPLSSQAPNVPEKAISSGQMRQVVTSQPIESKPESALTSLSVPKDSTHKTTNNNVTKKQVKTPADFAVIGLNDFFA